MKDRPNKKNRRRLLFVAALAALAVSFIFWKVSYQYARDRLLRPRFEFQKGMSYATWTKDRYFAPGSDGSLEALARTGTKWVALIVNWYQETCYTTRIFPTEKSASDSSLIHAIDKIHALGMKVMLKPHIDVIDTSGGSWRGEIACVEEADWEKWFDSYGEVVVHYAKLAQEHDVEMFCIGTELTSIATIKEELWKTKVIDPVRQVYKGPLTYAANWKDEYQHVKFWNEIDYVGIDAYFPLSEEDRPDLEGIKKGWEPWVKELEEFQAQVNKPIIFPEVGYCSSAGTARTPWEEITNGAAIDMELQANCYQALLEIFWGKEWFYGVYWWRWGTDVRFGGPANKGYSLQNKPAQKVVEKWYAERVGPRTKYPASLR